MQVFIEWSEKKWQIDLQHGFDISIPLRSGKQNPNAFGIPFPEFKPLQADGFIGSVQLGGNVNCENLFINAHGNGTHTECVGHIAKERITINQTLTSFFSMAQVISVTPENGTIALQHVKELIYQGIESLVIRNLPNSNEKLTQNYSGNNPVYLTTELCAYLADINIKNLLIDLPSVDPEHDEGKLSAHHAFWQYPANPRLQATITEMIFVPEAIKDGVYLLNMQIAPIESDASPSKPILYPLQHVL